MPTSFRCSFWSENDERLVSLAVGTRLVGLCLREGGASPFPWGEQNHKWLVHTCCQYSFGSENDKRLVSPSCRHSFWSEYDERLVPTVVGIRSGGLCRRKEGASTPLPGEKGSQVASVHRFSAVVMEQGSQMACAHRLLALVQTAWAVTKWELLLPPWGGKDHK